ncbi:MAG: carboxypeptidase-like regulatory domain-containing protein [Cytophagales bacterium]|nr:carboxypeptidase-like regulatory domain-containing protein [Cytophagales bacterium]
MFAWLVIHSGDLLAQPAIHPMKPLRGLVMSADGDEFLVGVHIYAKVAHAGSVSDQKGVFEMMVDQNDTLVVTFVGYERQIIPLVYFRDEHIDLVIQMDSEVIELPGITIFGEPNIDYLKRKDRNPLKIHGLKPPPEGPEVDVPVGSLDYGPLSRWGKEAKEKRKLLKVYRETQRQRIYVQTVSSDSVRNVFMYRYGINEKEYNDFIIFLNSYNPLMDRQDPEDIIRVMHKTFLEYRPARE